MNKTANENTWSAKGELPENRQRVLIWVGLDCISATYLSLYITEVHYIEEVFIADDKSFHSYRGNPNLRWMPMPTPPANVSEKYAYPKSFMNKCSNKNM